MLHSEIPKQNDKDEVQFTGPYTINSRPLILQVGTHDFGRNTQDLVIYAALMRIETFSFQIRGIKRKVFCQNNAGERLLHSENSEQKR